MYYADWPLYATDDGAVKCAHHDCDHIISHYIEGRRTNLGQFINAVRAHARVIHFTELTAFIADDNPCAGGRCPNPESHAEGGHDV